MTRTTLILAACLAVLASPANAIPPPVPFAIPIKSGVEVRNDTGVMRVTAITDSIIRVRIARGGRFPEEASWAVPAEVRARGVNVDLMANGFRTGALDVRIGQDSLGVDISDRQGHFIQRDPANAVSFAGSRFTLRKIMPPSEQYYGLGDKTGPFNRRGASYVNWTTDAWGFDRGTDPIYKSIPFYIAGGGTGGAYGFFLDNSWRSCVRLRPSRREHARDLGAMAGRSIITSSPARPSPMSSAATPN